jgi:hypothetical protein
MCFAAMEFAYLVRLAFDWSSPVPGDGDDAAAETFR